MAEGHFSPVGILALVIAAAMWAVYTLRFRRSRLPAIQAAALICVWSAALYLPVYLLAGLSRLSEASFGELARSEEHTSELQSLMRISYAVFCLNKKKNKIIKYTNDIL